MQQGTAHPTQLMRICASAQPLGIWRQGLLLAQEYLGTKPLHLWRQLHLVLLEGKERQETGELEVGMQWKDVLSKSVLEEGKSEQEKPKATRRGLPVACHKERRRKAGSCDTDNACQAWRTAAAKNSVPAQAPAAATQLVPAWLWELLSPQAALEANPRERAQHEGTSTPFHNALVGAPLGEAAIPIVQIGLVQHMFLIALPGKIAPEAQESVDIDTVHVASVLHVTAQVEFCQQALSSLLLLTQIGP